MEKQASGETSQIKRIRRYRLILMVIWTTIIAVLVVDALYGHYQSAINNATIDARSTYNKDLLYRRWMAIHGGVYVPITDYTPPNPYLDVPNREITTIDGQELTLVNPAYMTRQVHELALEQYGTRGHITSLNPIRPDNVPDAWESATLQSFEQGVEEATSVLFSGGEITLRYMRVMMTEESCLKCHGDQGYEVGDVRGGISVTVPLQPYLENRRISDQGTIISYSLLWIIGLLGINLSSKQILNSARIEAQSAQRLQDSEHRYKALYDGSMNAVFLHDFQGNLVEANDAALALFGYSHQEITTLNLADLIVPGDWPAAHTKLEDIMQTGQHDHPMAYTLRRRDGSLVHVETIASVIRHDDHQPLVQGIARDMTVHRRIEEQLRFLNRTAMELMNFTDEASIYNYLGQQLYQFVDGQAYVVVNRVPVDGEGFIIESIHGIDDSKLGQLANLLGVSPVGNSFPSDPEITPIFQKSMLHEYAGGISALAKNTLPEIITSQIERIFQIGRVYLIGICKDEYFFAGVQLYMRGDAHIAYPDTIETFVKQVSTALHRVRAEEALRESEGRMRALLHAIPDLMFHNHRDGTYLDFHAPDESKLMIAPDQIIGHKTQDIMPQDLAEKHMSHIHRTLETGEEQRYEYELTLGDETAIFEARMVRATVDEVLTIVRDVTESRRIQQELANSEAHLQSILQSQNTLILRTDLEGRYTYVNDTMYERFQWMYPTIEDMIGTDSMVTILEEDHAKTFEAVMACMEHPGKQIQVELRKPTAGGGYFWVFWEFIALKDKDGNLTGLQCNGIDITERKQAEQHAFDLALERERHQLLATFIRDAAHEFRTPLSTINTSAHLMVRSPDTERRHQKAQQIKAQVDRMTRLVDMLLLMSKLESNAPLQRVPTNLATILNDQARVFASDCTAHHQMVCQIPEALPFVSGDPIYLMELVRRLVENACRYTPDGGTITITAGYEDQRVWFEVRDTGIGIPDEVMPHIFQTFWRHDEMHHLPGFGLGLPIARRIIDQHRGIIEVKSVVGEGSVFRVTLPMVAPVA